MSTVERSCSKNIVNARYNVAGPNGRLLLGMQKSKITVQRVSEIVCAYNCRFRDRKVIYICVYISNECHA